MTLCSTGLPDVRFESKGDMCVCFWGEPAGRQAQETLVSKRQASWLAIIAVPTAIAGIYGVNFKNIPELQWEYGYFTIIGVVLIACATLYWRFRQVGWLWAWVHRSGKGTGEFEAPRLDWCAVFVHSPSPQHYSIACFAEKLRGLGQDRGKSFKTWPGSLRLAHSGVFV